MFPKVGLTKLLHSLINLLLLLPEGPITDIFNISTNTKVCKEAKKYRVILSFFDKDKFSG